MDCDLALRHTTASDEESLSKQQKDGKERPLEVMSHHWQAVVTPDGEELWLNLYEGHTQYKAPFITEAPEGVDGQSCAFQAYWGEITEPGKDMVRERKL